jgi:hypothetical protein
LFYSFLRALGFILDCPFGFTRSAAFRRVVVLPSLFFGFFPHFLLGLLAKENLDIELPVSVTSSAMRFILYAKLAYSAKSSSETDFRLVRTLRRGGRGERVME